MEKFKKHGFYSYVSFTPAKRNTTPACSSVILALLSSHWAIDVFVVGRRCNVVICNQVYYRLQAAMPEENQ